jgi:hypothetical protein
MYWTSACLDGAPRSHFPMDRAEKTPHTEKPTVPDVNPESYSELPSEVVLLIPDFVWCQNVSMRVRSMSIRPSQTQV